MASNYVPSQPIIRGIQAVGSVELRYAYNDRYLALPQDLMYLHDNLDGSTKISQVKIDTKPDDAKYGVLCAGFRLDSEFLRANPQIASSFMIPILGGGAVALTNNNRSGTLSLRTTKVSTPGWAEGTIDYTASLPAVKDENGNLGPDTSATAEISAAYTGGVGGMFTDSTNGIGVLGKTRVYDITTLLQAQQGQLGGDDVGATIRVAYKFNGLITALVFEGCTVANIDPIGLSGNDAVDYNATINYLNWRVNMSSESADPYGAFIG